MIYNEKTIRKVIRESLAEMLLQIRNTRVLREQDEKENKESDFDPEDVPGMPKVLQKVLDPDNSPQKFMKLDAMLDDSGTLAQQGGALAGFAITYSDLPLDNPSDPEFDAKSKETLQMMDKAKVALKQMIDKAKQAAQKESGESSEPA